MKDFPRQALNFWMRVREPRVVTVLHFIMYILIGIAGASALVEPPRSIEYAAGHELTAWWAWLMAIGGALGAAVVLPGIWWLERAAVLACIGAGAIYAVGICSLAVEEPGNKLVTLCLVLSLTLAYAVRWFRIRRYSYDPER